VRRWVAAAGALLAASCARVGPVSRPTGDGASRTYEVAALRFDAPAAWTAEGNARSVKLTSPGGDALLEVKASPSPAPAADCLTRAAEALEKGASALTGVRRHDTTFAGRKALFQEADQGGWHGWAWATCDAGEQYRVFLAGRTPVSRQTIDVQRQVVATARLGGNP
jgi:hypothetical protein